MDNIYRAFYTKNNYITKYMVSMISPTTDDKILEPCGGDGAFIDTMLEISPNLHIDTCDLNDKAVDVLEGKYADKPNIKVWQTDTLTDETFDGYAERNGFYDKIIGNPPYGGWQEYDRRAELKKKYNGFYVKETYSLFLLRCVSMLKDNGILSFIIPDTFLYLHNHTALRKYILTNTKIREILIFPSKFFPGVAFGYSNLSIITVQKTGCQSETLSNEVNIIKDLKKDTDIQRIGMRENLVGLTQIRLKQSDILVDEHHVFFINNSDLSAFIIGAEKTIGDVADCVTGIYTGNNTAFMGVTAAFVRNSKGYPVIEETEIEHEWSKLTGLNNGKKYIPIVKSSPQTKYFRESDDWLIDWSTDAMRHYNTDKKARFQNSAYYFKTGIAMPMVKSSKINAVLMQSRVFDQSIVGVFPKDGRLLRFLLAFINSDIANKLIHLINPTANNSANYIKKVPFIEPNAEDLTYIDGLVDNILSKKECGEEHEQINEYFNRLYSQVE